MLLISTNAVSMPFANGLTDTRRPFTSINVESAPRPRSDTLEPPFAVSSLLLAWVEKVPCPEIGSFANKPIKSVTPVFAISSADKLVTGDGPSKSVRLLWEPVISIRSTCFSSSAKRAFGVRSKLVEIMLLRVLNLNFVARFIVDSLFNYYWVKLVI